MSTVSDVRLACGTVVVGPKPALLLTAGWGSRGQIVTLIVRAGLPDHPHRQFHVAAALNVSPLPPNPHQRLSVFGLN